MNCKVEKSKIKGEIVCPSNKSYTHRGIFLASLAGNNSRIEKYPTISRYKSNDRSM